MFYELLQWCFVKYKEHNHKLDIPLNSTHIIMIESNIETTARKYQNLYKFKTIYMDKYLVPYDESTNEVYDVLCSMFDKLELEEFIHLVLPNQNLTLKFIPIRKYIDKNYEPEMIDRYYKDEDYICTCNDNSYECRYHKLIIENLFNKYVIKKC